LITGEKAGQQIAPRKQESMKILDISLPVSPDLPVWPGDPQIIVEPYRAQSKGDLSNDSRLACSVHSGTHLDAPSHFIENGATVEQLSLDILIGPAVVVELPMVDLITREVLENIALPADTDRLLFKTRNSSLWSDPHPKFKTDYVALSADAAGWIVHKAIRLVGIDYLSIQPFDDPRSATHAILLAAGVVIVEGLNLEAVKPGHYQIICLPVKLLGSDGAPVRAVLIEE
jgi:arylformamidase